MPGRARVDAVRSIFGAASNLTGNQALPDPPPRQQAGIRLLGRRIDLEVSDSALVPLCGDSGCGYYILGIGCISKKFVNFGKLRLVTRR